MARNGKVRGGFSKGLGLTANGENEQVLSLKRSEWLKKQ